MQTSDFPTSTFELTQPIQLQSIPANLQEVTVTATGKLTLHGVTKDVTVDLKARLNGSNETVTISRFATASATIRTASGAKMTTRMVLRIMVADLVSG